MKLNFHTTLTIAVLLAVIPALAVMAQTNPPGHDLATPEQVAASPESDTVVGPHGGSLRQTNGIQLETIVTRGGIQLFVYDLAGNPFSVSAARGAVSLLVPGNAKRYRYDLLPDGKGGLTAPVDLTEIAGRQIELDVRLVGIAAASGRVAFQEVAAVPASEAQLAAADIARHKTCPVTGMPLGSMGQPIKVVVADKPIFLCCKACIKKIQAEPAKYLAMVYGNSAQTQAPSQGAAAAVVPAGVEQVRAGVFKVTAADAPFIAAQKRCPVMDEPLDAMGGPYKVNAAGKAIYICCPGCAKKIAAEPKKYLGILSSQRVEAPIIR